MIVTVNFTPDYDYDGKYTLKIYKMPSNILVYTKVYDSPYSVPINENITVSGISSYKVVITANDCDKIVYQNTLPSVAYCGFPSTVYSANLTSTSVTIKWSPPSNGAPPIGYHYEVVQASTIITQGDTTLLSLDLSGLSPSTVYTAIISCICGTNLLGTPRTLTFTTLAP